MSIRGPDHDPDLPLPPLLPPRPRPIPLDVDPEVRAGWREEILAAVEKIARPEERARIKQIIDSLPPPELGGTQSASIHSPRPTPGPLLQPYSAYQGFAAMIERRHAKNRTRLDKNAAEERTTTMELQPDLSQIPPATAATASGKADVSGALTVVNPLYGSRFESEASQKENPEPQSQSGPDIRPEWAEDPYSPKQAAEHDGVAPDGAWAPATDRDLRLDFIPLTSATKAQLERELERRTQDEARGALTGPAEPLESTPTREMKMFGELTTPLHLQHASVEDMFHELKRRGLVVHLTLSTAPDPR